MTSQMQQDIENQINQLTTADYRQAFDAVKPTDNQIRILQFHYSAPGHTATARQIAYGIGYSDWNSINLHYGLFANKLCSQLDIHPDTKLYILVNFFKPYRDEYELTLRPQAAEALEELGLVVPSFQSTEENLGPNAVLTEGATYPTLVNAYERNPTARKQCIEHYGTSCFICGFNFERNYGPTAKDYIQVHHVVPLSSIRTEYIVDPIRDLRPLCANCHAMAHSRQPALSIESVQELLRSAASPA